MVTPKRKRVRITVRWHSSEHRWYVYLNGMKDDGPFRTKLIAVRSAVASADELERDGELVQVVIFKRNGQIQSERTYPRSSDPKERRG